MIRHEAAFASAVSVFEPLERRALLSATISGTVLQDITGNGLSYDDKALAGAVVRLHRDVNANGTLEAADGAAVATITTGIDGKFAFAGLATGKYLVRDVVPSTQTRTGPALSDTIAVDVTNANGTYGGLKFANYVKTFDRSAVTSFHYVINGTTRVATLNGNVQEGDVVTVHFTIAAGKKVHLSFVSYTATAPYSNAENLQDQRIYDVKTGIFAGGAHCMTVKVPKCFFQVDFVGGHAIDPFGPAGSKILYGAQHRIIDFANGGMKACTTCGDHDDKPRCDRDRKPNCDRNDKPRCDDKDDKKPRKDKKEKCDDRRDDRNECEQLGQKLAELVKNFLKDRKGFDC